MDAPFSLRFACERCLRSSVRLQVEVWLGLVEVPVKAHPDHHRNLTSRRDGRFEVSTGRIDDKRNVETVIVQCWCGEASGACLLLCLSLCVPRATALFFRRHRVLRRLISVLVGIENDCPAGRDYGIFQVHVIGLEVDTAKNGGHRVALAVGQTADSVTHGEGGRSIVWRRERQKDTRLRESGKHELKE